MAQESQQSKYTQGHSNYTIATHLRRNAEQDAAFLLPYIKETDRILDVGCGPGTITTSLAKYASQGSTIGLDLSADVLHKAKTLAAEANIPTDGPGSVTFVEGNVLEGLPYPDDTFDIVYSSQVLGHMPPLEVRAKALSEMRRVLKPGGIVASRDAISEHFYPEKLDLKCLWTGNNALAIRKGAPEPDERAGPSMPAAYRRAGFDADGGKVKVGAGTKVLSGPTEDRKWLLWRAAGQLKEGDPFHQSWLDVGITESEIQETLRAVEKWVETEDAWFVSVQSEIIAWK